MHLSDHAAAVERFDSLVELLDAEVYGHLAQRLWPLMVGNRFDHIQDVGIADEHPMLHL